jgi:hypothetical protein
MSSGRYNNRLRRSLQRDTLWDTVVGHCGGHVVGHCGGHVVGHCRGTLSWDTAGDTLWDTAGHFVFSMTH